MPLRDLTLPQLIQHADRVTQELVKKHMAKKNGEVTRAKAKKSVLPIKTQNRY